MLSSDLGHVYLRGDGVAKDAEQAVSWYRRAAEAGHADAQFNLGNMLLYTVTELPRMQSRQYRGTAVQRRQVMQTLSLTWASATLMAMGYAKMQSRQCRGIAVQRRQAMQSAQFNLGALLR